MNRNWLNAMKMQNIYSIYEDASLSNCLLIPTEIVKLGEKWVNHSRRPNMYLYGNTGSGKTHFATALFRGLIENNHNWVIFIRSDDLDSELLDAIADKKEKSTLQKYCEVPILFIDDLGVEKQTERMVRQYYTIIDKRVGERLTTVITSNRSKESLRESMGDRTVSRLEHFFEVEFPQKDLRKNIKITEL